MKSGKTNTWRGRNNPTRLLCGRCGKRGVGPPKALPQASPPGSVFHRCRYCRSLHTPAEVERLNPDAEPCAQYRESDSEYDRSKDICQCGHHLDRHHTPAPWELKLESIEDRILQAHQLLIEIARDLRLIDDFDHAQDMSNAALFCRAARNELREGRRPTEPVKAMRGRRFSSQSSSDQGAKR